MPRQLYKLVIKSPCAHKILKEGSDSEIQVWNDLAGNVCAYGYTYQGTYWMEWPELAFFNFNPTQDIVFAIPILPVLPDLIEDTFQRSVLPFVLQTHGREVIHASAVKGPHGVIAFCAASGTGKSTIAYGLSLREFPLWADDAVTFEIISAKVKTNPLSFRIRMLPEVRDYFSQEHLHKKNPTNQLTGALVEPKPEEISILFVLERYLEDNSKDDVEIERLQPQEAFSAILAHAYCFNLQDNELKRQMVHNYLELINLVPVVRLRFANGLDQLPYILDIIEQTIKSLSNQL